MVFSLKFGNIRQVKHLPMTKRPVFWLSEMKNDHDIMGFYAHRLFKTPCEILIKGLFLLPVTPFTCGNGKKKKVIAAARLSTTKIMPIKNPAVRVITIKKLKTVSVRNGK
ncbi:hypothetical protein SZ66_17595 [Pantoea ananatis]|nr:hypothetical protein [Pantoea ananatis]